MHDEEDGVLPFPTPPREPQTEAVAWSDAGADPLAAIEAFAATMQLLRMRFARLDDEEALAQLAKILAAGGRLACAPDVYRRFMELSPEAFAALGGPEVVFKAPLLPAGTVAAVPRGMTIPELLR
jgi:hypothetical protein